MIRCISGFISPLSAGIAAGQTEEVNIRGISRQKGTLIKLYLGFLQISAELFFLLLCLAILFEQRQQDWPIIIIGSPLKIVIDTQGNLPERI